MMSRLILQKPGIDSLSSLLQTTSIEVDVLRLDKVHPLVSGNKWYKLKGWLEEAASKEKSKIATWGGAWSNHLVATAAAGKLLGLEVAGLVRGEKPSQLSKTLQDAESMGMRLYFLSRQQYSQKILPDDIGQHYFLIPEGGYGQPGLQGMQELFEDCQLSRYTHILSAVGTGTTLAGLIAASSHLQILGVTILKNHESIREEINQLLPPEKNNLYELITEFEFGGYAKHPPELIGFMNEWYRLTQIPSDIVYTGKLFYAANTLVRQGYFPEGSRVLLLHSGGLQGNTSLPKGTLIF